MFFTRSHDEFVGFGHAGTAHGQPSAPNASGQSLVQHAAVLRRLLNEADSDGRPWQHEWVRPPEAAALVALLQSVGHPSIDLSSFTQHFSSLHTVSCPVKAPAVQQEQNLRYASAHAVGDITTKLQPLVLRSAWRAPSAW